MFLRRYILWIHEMYISNFAAVCEDTAFLLHV
jgi:hypothetical protein